MGLGQKGRRKLVEVDLMIPEKVTTHSGRRVTGSKVCSTIIRHWRYLFFSGFRSWKRGGGAISAGNWGSLTSVHGSGAQRINFFLILLYFPPTPCIINGRIITIHDNCYYN